MLDLFPRVNPNAFEQRTDIFYDRLQLGESDEVRKLVEDVAQYMRPKVSEGLLIAGVGGILRKEDPRAAKDIDLAIVGLNYPSDHSFDDVVEFTRIIHDYFELLGTRLGAEYGDHSFVTFKGGSGPLARLEGCHSFGRGVEGSVESHIESFGDWNSKGLQIQLPYIRPIDMQFVFKRSPRSWRIDQATSEHSGGPLYYSVLSQ